MYEAENIPLWFNWSLKKELVITFPNDEVIAATNTNIKSDSLLLKESILDSENLEFVGCIPSRFEVSLYNILDDIELKGKYIHAYFKVTDNEETTVMPLFHGYIESVSKNIQTGEKKITAYDALYTVGNTDVAEWYRALPYQYTVKEFRDGLFDTLGITQVDTSLPNDNVKIYAYAYPSSVKALDLIKSICQINGVYGIINRQGKFEYRTINKTDVNLTGQYKELSLQSYEVQIPNKVSIRTSSTDTLGYESGTGTNNYIVQGNVFTLNRPSDNQIQMLCDNLHTHITNNYSNFTPYTGSFKGFPYLECGDIVTADGHSLFIANRTLKGIQAVSDTFAAQGEELQSEFITDTGLQLDDIRTTVATTTDEITEDVTTSVTNNVNRTITNTVNTAVSNAVQVAESLIEVLNTNLTKFALKPNVTKSGDTWVWSDHIVNEDQTVTYTPTFSTSTKDTYRQYINIEDIKIKFIYDKLVQPSDYSKIYSGDVVYLTINNKQIYYKSLSDLTSGFTTISPRVNDKTISTDVEDMYKCRRLASADSATWDIEIFSDVTSTSTEEDAEPLKKIGVRLNTFINIDYNTRTGVYRNTLTSTIDNKEYGNVIQQDVENSTVAFYKRYAGVDYADRILAVYDSLEDAQNDENLPVGSIILIK